MARRKRVIDDSEDSDSDEGSDFDADNDDSFQHKRRRKNGKDDALYGIFGEDSDEGTSKGKKPEKKSDWTKAPAFVSGDNLDIDKEMEVEMDDAKSDSSSNDEQGSGEEADGGRPEYSDNDSEPSRPASPREPLQEEEPVIAPRMGGIGSGSRMGQARSLGGIGSRANSFASSSIEPLPEPRKGGIGSSRGLQAEPPQVPTSFGKRSFVRSEAPSPKPTASPADLAHFSKLQGSFGARMLAKMGWEAGTGLGSSGEGIVTPVESKLRPQKMGIAFKGFKEKTDQSKKEAKRRGEDVSDDEQDKKAKKAARKAKEEKEKKADVWKKPKKVKVKVEHKSYEQIIAEAGQDAPSGIGMIIDATGATPREVSSLSEVSKNPWSPSNDPTRIPEIRHNLRTIVDTCKTDLDGLAREAKALEERKKWTVNEDLRLRRKVIEETELISRLQQVQIVAEDINSKAKELSSSYEATLEPFTPLFYKLLDQYPSEFERYRLDELVVAAIGPIVRRMVAQWNPLEDPTSFISTFRSWKGALKVNPVEPVRFESQVDVYGSRTISSAPVVLEKPMTPFESLLWTVWLPKVRSCINNDWAPQVPQPAVKLYEAWSSFLPAFIRDNLLDQLILPKIQKAVVEWHPRKTAIPLQSLIFPWLPHVGLRLDDFVADPKRKLKSLLKSWAVGDEIPADLLEWKEFFDDAEWDSMFLKNIVPKLGATLRDDFRINPREQKMEPLENVLLWSKIIRPSIFGQLIETTFFSKWLDVLYIWLIQPNVSFEQVAQWYSFWKGSFPQNVQDMPGVSAGFTRGLQLMNKAIELGPDAPTKLPKPDHSRRDGSAPNSPVASAPGKVLPRPSASRTHEITFKSIVEDFAAAKDLMLVPAGRAHTKSRMPLFRVSKNADGKKGLLVYILDDAVWAPGVGLPADTEDYRAISLDDMVQRADIT